MEIVRTEETLTYHVATYIAELVAQYLPDCHPPVLSPAEPAVRLSAHAQVIPGSDEEAYMRTVPYMSLVGSLSYIAVNVRPEIARAVHTCNVLRHTQRGPIGRQHCMFCNTCGLPLRYDLSILALRV